MTKQFCEVCLDDRQFDRIKIEEEVTVKDLTFMIWHEYDQCQNCKELFEPIEDIDKNIKFDYREYRTKVGFLQPEEIKELREKYGMSLRQFSELLGIGYSTLSHIENGSLQSWYQNSLFVLVSSPSAMYSLLNDRIEYTKENYDDVLEKVKELSIKEHENMFNIAKNLEEQIKSISDKTLYYTRKLNELEFDIKQYDYNEEVDTKRKEKSYSWIEKTSNLFQLNL